VTFWCILIIKPTRCTNFSNLLIRIKLYIPVFKLSPCSKYNLFLFWVIPRRLSSNCRRFGTHYRFHLHRQVNERRQLELRCQGITQKGTNYKTLHVSDSSSVHHQEFFTVHTAMVYVIQVLLTACKQFRPETARKLSANLYDMYHWCVYSEKLLMMDRGTVRNM